MSVIPCAECGVGVSFGKFAERLKEIPKKVLCPDCKKKDKRQPEPQAEEGKPWKSRR